MFEELEKFKRQVSADFEALIQSNKELTALNKQLNDRVTSLEKSVYTPLNYSYESSI
jgi:hypothetical protein